MTLKHLFNITVAFIKMLALAGLLFGNSVLALADEAESRITDLTQDADVFAWFADENRTIRWCCATTRDSRLSCEFKSALENWRKYFEQKFPSQTSAKIPRLSFKEKKVDCDGTEDLKVAIGTEDAEIASIKAKYIDPLGFAHLKSYEPKSRWGKGLIWISATGSEIDRYRILMHEIGHMLGCGHVEGTVMAEGIAIAGQSEAESDFPAASIDRARQLLLPSDSSILSTMPKRTKGGPLKIPSNDLLGFDGEMQELGQDILRILTGQEPRSPIGRITASARIFTPANWIGKLWIEQSKARSSGVLLAEFEPDVFQFELNRVISETPFSPSPVFRTVSTTEIAELQSMGRTLSGFIYGLNFKKIPILVQENFNRRMEFILLQNGASLNLSEMGSPD